MINKTLSWDSALEITDVEAQIWNKFEAFLGVLNLASLQWGEWDLCPTFPHSLTWEDPAGEPGVTIWRIHSPHGRAVHVWVGFIIDWVSSPSLQLKGGWGANVIKWYFLAGGPWWKDTGELRDGFSFLQLHNTWPYLKELYNKQNLEFEKHFLAVQPFYFEQEDFLLTINGCFNARVKVIKEKTTSNFKIHPHSVLQVYGKALGLEVLGGTLCCSHCLILLDDAAFI